MMKTTPIIAADAVRVRMENPVLVDQAPPEVQEWGRYRMPKVYRLPSGDLGLTYEMGRDHYCDEGIPSPLFVSSDDGCTWERSEWPHPGFTGINPTISPIHDGEYYCLPAVTGLELDLGRLPKPVGTFIPTCSFPIFRLEDCPEDVIAWFRDLKAMRWSPQTQLWTQESVQWDHRGQLIFSYNDKPENIPGDWTQKLYIESPLVRSGKELLHAEYYTVYETMTGKVPLSWECSLMVSTDNARSWTRRSTIANMPANDDTNEPVITLNQTGELVCVIRGETKQPPSMYLTHSKDQGYTWSELQTLIGYGVFPRLLQLANGVLALSYGRAPGTWITFSLDGGYSWTQSQCLLAPDQKKDSSYMPMSCGYTSMVALSPDTLLLAYGDRYLPNAKGEPCKSILVRQITVEPSR